MSEIKGIKFKRVRVPILSEEVKDNLITPFSAAEATANEDYMIDRKDYPCTLMLYTVSGEGKLFYEGEEYSLTENKLMAIDCRKPHRYFPPTGYWEHQYFDFAGVNTEFFTKKLNESNVVMDLTLSEKEHFLKIINLFFTDDEDFGIMFNSECMSFVSNLIIRSRVRESDISKGIDYIKKHFCEEIPGDLPASLCHMSEGSFCRKFKRIMGTTPHSYMIKLKVEYAAQLLQTSRLSVDEISEKVGFYDQNHLIRHFKNLIGITPSKYRRKGIVFYNEKQ